MLKSNSLCVWAQLCRNSKLRHEIWLRRISGQVGAVWLQLLDEIALSQHQRPQTLDILPKLLNFLHNQIMLWLIKNRGFRLHNIRDCILLHLPLCPADPLILELSHYLLFNRVLLFNNMNKFLFWCSCLSSARLGERPATSHHLIL